LLRFWSPGLRMLLVPTKIWLAKITVEYRQSNSYAKKRKQILFCEPLGLTNDSQHFKKPNAQPIHTVLCPSGS
jgi:hypothetical protein